MRTDRRYTRTRDMLLDEAVPRLASGGIALCHLCQRSVYFAGGFLEILMRQIERRIKNDYRGPGCCPKCGTSKVYKITRGSRLRCVQCRYDWSATAGTDRHAAKKPNAWYTRIIELHNQGLNPHQIGKEIGSEAKAIYAFLRRKEIADRVAVMDEDRQKGTM